MRKFIVYNRPLPGCRQTEDVPAVLEVEGELITALEDVSILWLPEGEFKFRILKPESLYEPHEIIRPDKSKEKVMLPPIYHSHAVYWTVSGARVAAEKMTRQMLEFTKRKKGVEFSEEEVKAKFAEIQEIFL